MQLKTTISKKEFIENLNTSIIDLNNNLINDIMQSVKNKSFNNENEKIYYILKELNFFDFISIDSIPLLIISSFSNSIRLNLFCKNEYDNNKNAYDDIILKNNNDDDFIENNALFRDKKGFFSDILCECFDFEGIIGYRFYNDDTNYIIASDKKIENYYNISSYQFYTLCFLFNHIYKDCNCINTDDYKYYTIVHDYKLFNIKDNANNKIKFVENTLFNNNVKSDFLYYCDERYLYNNIELNINANNTVIILNSLINNNLNFNNFSITMENKE